MNIFVSMEGFQIGRAFIPKEVTILSEGEEWKHFLFLPPTMVLSSIDHRTIRHATRNLHQLTWTDGDVPYSMLYPILTKFRDSTVYTYGSSTTNFLKEALPTSVIVDVQKEGFEMPGILFKRCCFSTHDARQCSLVKAHAVKEFTFTGLTSDITPEI